MAMAKKSTEGQVVEPEDHKKDGQVIPINQNRQVSVKYNHQMTEDDLCADIKQIRNHQVVSEIVGNWMIGKKINTFYCKNYGENELQRIAGETDIKIGTLYKALQFAKRYTEKQVCNLLNGHFTFSWRQVVKNLSLQPETLIALYKGSNTLDEFCNAVTIYKSSTKKQIDVLRKFPKRSDLEIAEAAWKMERKELEKIIKELQEKNKDLKDENGRLLNEKVGMIKEIDDLTMENDELTTENDELKTYKPKHIKLYVAP